MARFRQQMADYARGERLKELREAKHLSQEEAAHQIGVSTKAYRTWEKGGKMKWPNAKSAGRVLGASAETLVTRDDEDVVTADEVQEAASLNEVLAKLAAVQSTLKEQQLLLETLLRKQEDDS